MGDRYDDPGSLPGPRANLSPDPQWFIAQGAKQARELYEEGRARCPPPSPSCLSTAELPAPNPSKSLEKSLGWGRV